MSASFRIAIAHGARHSVGSSARKAHLLCLHQIYRKIEATPRHPSTTVCAPSRRAHSKLGALWKLMYVVEPLPAPSTSMLLRDEKNELLVLDGPFAETKA